MSWGDPYDKFYQDVKSTEERLQDFAAKGFVPGALVYVGNPEDPRISIVYVWKEADWDSGSFTVTATGIGTIISLDCSDPTYDWLLMLMSTPEQKTYGWVPLGTVRLVKDDSIST